MSGFPYCFIAPDKKTTKRQDIELISAPVDAGDVLMIETLPVACIERTVVDLLRCNEDESLVCDFLRDMLMRFERPVDQERLAEFLSPLAQKRGFTRNDGAAYAQMLIRTAFDRSARKGVGEALRSLMDKYREYSGVGEEGYDFFNDYILAPPGAEETGKGER